jgi:hypothetical protein
MADAVLEEFLNASRTHAGGDPTEELRQATRALLLRAKTDPSILRAAAEALPTLPPLGAGWLAIVLGSAIESGQSAELSAPALLQFLRSWLPRLPKPEITQDEDGEEIESFPDPTPEQEALFEGLPRVCQGLVAHLARLPDERETLVEDLEFLERLADIEGYSNGPGWVREALLRSSGTLIALHPPSGSGLKLRYENVATCFHLFSLLQTAVGTRMPGGRQPDPAIAARARGQTDDDVYDEAWWHYGDPTWKTADLHHSIWGEGLVREIPVINGSPVMLLWPPIMESRSWDAGFFGPHLQALPANVAVEEELSPESCQAWLRTLGIK